MAIATALRQALLPCLAVVAASWLAMGSALAQSYAHPPKDDFDAASEQYSEFWEQVLTANDEGIDALIAHSRNLWDSGGKQERSQAMRELRAAIKSKADSAPAHFWLGQFQFEAREWQGCADAFSQTYELNPDFVIDDSRANTNLQQNLAACLLYSGQYESAIDHFKRLLALRPGSAELQLRLGESLMAMGRLQEAIDALYVAQEQSVQSASRIAYAVALDRAERLTESKEILEREVRRSPDLSALRAADKIYAPAEDEHYYLGLAYAAQAKSARALYHFRRYLAVAPNSAWAERARAHRDALGRPEFAARIEHTGSAAWNGDEMRIAIRKQAEALRRCLEGQPLILARVSISGVVGTAGSHFDVQASIEAQVDGEQKQLEDNIECLESAARKIAIPKLVGSNGSHATAQFSILGDS